MTPKDAVKYDHEFPNNSWLVQPTISFDNENELIDIMKQLVSKNSEID
jgi:tetraacyldisaccharide-1-P 4'-kinase